MQFGFEQCPYCNCNAPFVYVHGHYQCVACKQNVMPCCGGEQEVVKPTEMSTSLINQQNNL